MEDLTSLEAENKKRTIIIIKGKNECLLKKIQETKLQSHVTDVTSLDTMPMNIQTNARINNRASADIAGSAEIERVQKRRDSEAAGVQIIPA
ncbi:hypothetical protein Tco_0603574 [Tanacetum coccineum]